MIEHQRVVLIAHGLSNGGAERVASIIANELFDRGYDVLFLSVYNGEVSYSIRDGIVYKYIKCRSRNKIMRYIKRSVGIIKEVRKFNADHIISFIYQEVLFYSLLFPKKLIVSERRDPRLDSKIQRIIKNLVYKRAKGIVFQTKGSMDCFSKKIEQKGVMIANPMRSELPQWSIDNHLKSIVTASRITREKNLEMLIESFYNFSKVKNNYDLKIYGAISDEVYYKELKEFANNLNVDEKIEFCGHHKDVQTRIIQGEIFVLTSNNEGLSNSMLEALCMGMPTICTDYPSKGASMFINNGTNGFLVEVGNGEQFTQRLLELAGNDEMLLKFSRESLKINNVLNKDVIVEKWIEVMKEGK